MFFSEAFGDISLDEPNDKKNPEDNDSMSIVVEGLEKIIKTIKTQTNPN